jgi:anti-anti-sigma factor
MQIRIRIHGETLDVQARGAMTADAAAELQHEVDKELSPRPRDVALDLGNVDWISAGALPYVFRIQNHVEQLQRHMVVTAVSDAVQRLLDRTHVADHLDVVTAESALSSH